MTNRYDLAAISLNQITLSAALIAYAIDYLNHLDRYQISRITPQAQLLIDLITIHSIFTLHQPLVDFRRFNGIGDIQINVGCLHLGIDIYSGRVTIDWSNQLGQ